MATGGGPHDPAAGFKRYREIVDDWAAFREALDRPLPSCVWVNTLRVDRDTVLGLLAEAGLGPRPLAWRPDAFRLADTGFGGRWWHAAGLVHVQEEASMVPVRVLDPRPGHRVLDLCAAPGGKTAQIALALLNRGTVVANDMSASRLRALRGTLDRLGLYNVTVTQADGGNYPRDAGSFDRILVDAPCSGEGTLRRQTRKTMQSSATYSLRFRGKQEALLRKAARLLTPGGRMVYSTCTFAPEENEAVIDAVLAHYPDFRLHVLPFELAGLRTGDGLTGFGGATYRDDLQNARRIWPHHNDTGGFFVALIEKAGGDPANDGDGSRLDPVPEAEWRSVAAERFGIAEQVWGALVVHRRSSTALHMAAADHVPPRAPEPATVGVRLVTDRVAWPKLSTAAAMVLAREATRNVTDLDLDQTERFLRRETFPLSSTQAALCSDYGYVLARHRGFGLGIGLYEPTGPSLQSQFPKRWSS